MQCTVCQVDFPDAQESCPRCEPITQLMAATTTIVPESGTEATEQDTQITSIAMSQSHTDAEEGTGEISPPSSPTLIRFPTNARPARPQWRKELSERVREIQERRAREAALEASESAMQEQASVAHVATSATQLGLVAPTNSDAPPSNPIVQAALRRVERARQSALPAVVPPPTPSPQPVTKGATAAAIAAAPALVPQIAEERKPEAPKLTKPPLVVPKTNEASGEIQSVPASTSPTVQLLGNDIQAPMNEKVVREEKVMEAVRAPSVFTQPPQSTPAIEYPVTTAAIPSIEPKPHRILTPADDFDASVVRTLMPPPVEEEALPTKAEEIFEDLPAPFVLRAISGVLDLSAIAFFSSPFAAIIELTSGNWADVRVTLSLAGIILVVAFLYLAASCALWGRTWGMSMLSLHLVDAETGAVPTIRQCVKRALIFMVSLGACGLGILYAFLDREGRTAHDYFSNTMIVRN